MIGATPALILGFGLAIVCAALARLLYRYDRKRVRPSDVIADARAAGEAASRKAEQQSIDERFWMQVRQWPGITAREFDATVDIPDVPEGLYDGLPGDQTDPSERESQ